MPIRQPQTRSQTILKALRKTKYLLRSRDRWIKGRMRRVGPRGKKCYCLLGAVEAACDLTTHWSDRDDLIRTVRAEIRKSIDNFDIGYQHDGAAISDFNDYYYRRYASILRVLNETIKRVEAEYGTTEN